MCTGHTHSSPGNAEAGKQTSGLILMAFELFFKCSTFSRDALSPLQPGNRIRLICSKYRETMTNAAYSVGEGKPSYIAGSI